ncbi:hypothetical protein CCACVL1_27429 [Corchorus capsularis]|uniref:F-box domain-containing protein n=1 Tax=Corchorus capsularis TaxID=210143 RepID=A0A1R3GAK5_COCAP|nr:hypothetical protein CCACVL1_27429 [Corchorus capsularis]
MQKWNRLESPPHPHETHAPSPQSSKRSKKAEPSPLFVKPNFPQEIILEIFSNLPVGSLLRFRCLSKSCKSFIADPFFIKKHLVKTQNDDPKFTKERVLLYACDSRNSNSYRSCSLNAVCKDPFIDSIEVAYPSKEFHSFDRILGSCNGLICIHSRDTHFLFNPTLGIDKRLPDLGFKRRGLFRTVYGLGYDASLDDYKVVRVFTPQINGFEYASKSIVRVYSWRTNSWRRIQDLALGAPFDETGKYVDGSLNWSAFRRQETGFSWIIVSLDLAKETFKEVLQPCYGNGVSDKSLGLLNGCLCVFCNYGELYIDVWVMREYGKIESWTKLFTIPYLSGPGFELFSTSKPLYVSGSDEILLHIGVKLILYNPKENTFRVPVIDEDHIFYMFQSAIYVESLVSPFVINHH